MQGNIFDSFRLLDRYLQQLGFFIGCNKIIINVYVWGIE